MRALVPPDPPCITTNSRITRWAVIALLVVIAQSCNHQNSDITQPARCTPDPTNLYGKGTFSCELPEAGGIFRVVGKYKPSSSFGSDTSSSEGAGGFCIDTLYRGEFLRGRLLAYNHSIVSNTLFEKVFIVDLIDSARGLDTGQFILTLSGIHAAPPCATLQFLLSDSSHFFSAYTGVAGKLTVASLDTCARTISGSFSATLVSSDNPLDTIHLSGGQFDITYVKRFFYY